MSVYLRVTNHQIRVNSVLCTSSSLMTVAFRQHRFSLCLNGKLRLIINQISMWNVFIFQVKSIIIVDLLQFFMTTSHMVIDLVRETLSKHAPPLTISQQHYITELYCFLKNRYNFSPKRPPTLECSSHYNAHHQMPLHYLQSLLCAKTDKFFFL